MVGIGGLFVMGGGYFPGTIPQWLGAISVLLASVNVAGGFVITKRMLDMFKRWSHPHIDWECDTQPRLIFLQVQLIPQNIRGSMVFLQLSSQVASLLQQAPACQVSCRPDTSRAAFSALVSAYHPICVPLSNTPRRLSFWLGLSDNCSPR